MTRRALSAVLLAVLALGGCTGGSNEPGGSSSVEDRAQSLWLDRTAYVGDNSKVIALVDGAGFGSMGAHTLSLQTEQAPYGVDITFSSLGKPFDTVDFTPQATLVLGLVENLDQVTVRSGESTRTYTSADVSGDLGYDVKTLAQDVEKLETYLQSLED